MTTICHPSPPLCPPELRAARLLKESWAAELKSEEEESEASLSQGISMPHRRVAAIKALRLGVRAKAWVGSVGEGVARRLQSEGPHIYSQTAKSGSKDMKMSRRRDVDRRTNSEPNARGFVRNDSRAPADLNNVQHKRKALLRSGGRKDLIGISGLTC